MIGRAQPRRLVLVSVSRHGSVIAREGGVPGFTRPGPVGGPEVEPSWRQTFALGCTPSERTIRATWHLLAG